MRTVLRFTMLAVGLAAIPGEAAEAQQVLRPIRPAVTQATASEQEIVPPPALKVHAPATAVVLKPASTDQLVRSLPVRRRFTLQALRAQPVLTLGATKVDMGPVLANPASLANVATRLAAKAALARVSAERTEVLEVEQGLIVRQFLGYQVKTGVCTDPVRKAQLAGTGVSCFVRESEQARDAAFANPQDPRYVANPALRSKAVAAARQEAAQEQADLASGIARFRAMMKDPAQRGQVVAEVGAGEAARLDALDDAALEAELVNSADTQIEDVMFVPAHDRLEAMARPQLAMRKPPMQVPRAVDVDHALQSHVLLTGFTLGREYEWRRRVSITVKTCLVSCKKTYYVEVYAGFGYGFGLRFPIRLGGLYSYHRLGDEESASVAPVFEPIDGSEQDYSSTGLAASQVFRGKELVAELTAYAGMNFKVPFYSDGVSANVGEDFTESLPAPFTNGQFKPPAPGAGNALNKEIVFDNPDLLAGLANYGVVGAKILPAVKVGLTSDRLRLKLTDNISGKETEVVSSGATYPLRVDPNDHSSSFTIGYPEYSLAFDVTPGLAARLFVDVAIWSHNWDWPVWFPQAAVTFPPGGMAFQCHAQTTCAYDYRYSPTLTQETANQLDAPSNLLEEEVFKWRKAFLRKYLGQCPYMKVHFCETAIRAVAQTMGNGMIHDMGAVGKYPSNEAAMIMLKKTIEADQKGKAIVLENKVVAIEQHGKSLFASYEPIWSEGCADQPCRDHIHALGGQYVAALKKRQQASPAKSMDEIVDAENAQGGWAARAEQEVTASRNRISGRAVLTPRRRLP